LASKKGAAATAAAEVTYASAAAHHLWLWPNMDFAGWDEIRLLEPGPLLFVARSQCDMPSCGAFSPLAVAPVFHHTVDISMAVIVSNQPTHSCLAGQCGTTTEVCNLTFTTIDGGMLMALEKAMLPTTGRSIDPGILCSRQGQLAAACAPG